MNKRIKELAQRAGGEFYTGFLGSPNSIKFGEEDFEKFAKLFIEDVLSFLESERKDYDNPGPYMGDSEYYDQCAAKEEALESAIKGVKWRYDLE